MIMPVCVKPYPGELLYGWIVRLAKLNEYSSVKQFCERYFFQGESSPYRIEKLSPVRLDYRFNLDYLCGMYGELKCFPDVISVLKNMIPYYALMPFWSYGYQVKRSQMILREQRKSILNIGPLDNDVKELRYCPECAKEDRNVYGEPYLHTEHHLPGVTKCAKHHLPLISMQNRNICFANSQQERNKKTEPKLSLAVQEKLSAFMTALFHDPVQISLTEMQAILKEKIMICGYPEVSPYGTLAEDMKKSGFEFKNPLEERSLYAMLNEEHVALETLLLLINFLFGDYREFRSMAAKYERHPFFEASDYYEGYEVLSIKGGFYRLRCKTCNSEFYIHPYALEMGHICPECEKRKTDEENINRMLAHLGDGEYCLSELSGGKQTVVLHKICGQERRCNIQDILYRERECNCVKRLSIKGIQARVGNDFTVMGMERKKSYIMITLQHSACGYIFSTALGVFLKNPFCRNCDIKHSPEPRFREKMKELAGDEYELVSPYRSVKNIVRICHRKCGTVTSMKAENFLYGCRCKLCTKPLYKEDMAKILLEYAGSEYQLVGIKGHKVSIQDSSGKIHEEKMPYFIQELSRPTESEVFKDRKKILIPELSERGKFYIEVKECCEKYQVYISDFRPEEEGYTYRKNIAKKLVRDGYLYRLTDGVYSLDTDIEDDEIIVKQKYLERQGNRIGVYYGPSLAYQCGILKKEPERCYILCNNIGKGFRAAKVRNTIIQVKGAYVPITNENFQIIEGLNLLMFLVNYSSYQKAVEDYLIRNQIYKRDMENYIDSYPESVLKIFDCLYK